jgi:hypothetical protein
MPVETSAAASRKSLFAVVLLIGISLAGCTTTVRTESAESQPVEVASDDIDVVPPVPSFTSAMDCELAYGTGACGTGAVVYQSVGIAAPVGAYEWYVPYAFGVMTGVLINHYFAPPGTYIAGFQYRNFTSTTVVNNYKVINQTAINNYNRAPLDARAQAMRTGPVRYSQSRGVVRGTARVAGFTPSHPSAIRGSSNGAASTMTRSAKSTATAPSYNRGIPSRPTAPSSSSHAYAPSTSTSHYASAQTSRPRSSTYSYTPPTRTAAPSYAPRAAQPTTYTAPRPVPTYTAPRPAQTYSPPANSAAKICRTPTCR